MNKKVAIVGYTDTYLEAPFDDKEWDIWGFNHRFDRFPRFDLWFDIHKLFENNAYGDFLKVNQDKILIADMVDWLPKAKRYPKEDIMQIYGNYFTCSMSWMIVYAIYKGYTDIGIYGIDLTCKDEYIKQKPSIMYFIGLAKGMGINIILPDTCKLFLKEKLYWL